MMSWVRRSPDSVTRQYDLVLVKGGDAPKLQCRRASHSLWFIVLTTRSRRKGLRQRDKQQRLSSCGTFNITR